VSRQIRFIVTDVDDNPPTFDNYLTPMEYTVGVRVRPIARISDRLDRQNWRHARPSDRRRS
jgi:hypothetical protein